MPFFTHRIISLVKYIQRIINYTHTHTLTLHHIQNAIYNAGTHLMVRLIYGEVKMNVCTELDHRIIYDRIGLFKRHFFVSGRSSPTSAHAQPILVHHIVFVYMYFFLV